MTMDRSSVWQTPKDLMKVLDVWNWSQSRFQDCSISNQQGATLAFYKKQSDASLVDENSRIHSFSSIQWTISLWVYVTTFFNQMVFSVLITYWWGMFERKQSCFNCCNSEIGDSTPPPPPSIPVPVQVSETGKTPSATCDRYVKEWIRGSVENVCLVEENHSVWSDWSQFPVSGRWSHKGRRHRSETDTPPYPWGLFRVEMRNKNIFHRRKIVKLYLQTWTDFQRSTVTGPLILFISVHLLCFLLLFHGSSNNEQSFFSFQANTTKQASVKLYFVWHYLWASVGVWYFQMYRPLTVSQMSTQHAPETFQFL